MFKRRTKRPGMLRKTLTQSFCRFSPVVPNILLVFSTSSQFKSWVEIFHHLKFRDSFPPFALPVLLGCSEDSGLIYKDLADFCYLTTDKFAALFIIKFFPSVTFSLWYIQQTRTPVLPHTSPIFCAVVWVVGSNSSSWICLGTQTLEDFRPSIKEGNVFRETLGDVAVRVSSRLM